MKASICLVLCLTLTSSAFADCVKPVTLLEQGAQAPCRGYLFTPEKELEVRILKRESLLDKEEVEALQKQVDKLVKKDKENDAILEKKDQQLDLWRVRAEESTMKLVQSEENKHTKDLLLVGSGFVLALLSAWAWSKVK